MDLETAAEELYAGSPDDFVERRTALLAAARKARERELAKQIGALRRPTRTAWLVNLLAREATAEVDELLALGEALADAQRRGSGADLRQLSTERRRLVDRLARQAVALGATHDYTAPDAALQEVSQTLQSALGDDETREQLRAGRLTTAVSYGGFGPTDLMAAMAASLPSPQPEPEPEPEDEPEPPFDKLREQAEAAQQAEAEAERDAEEATAHADELADRIEELRAELTAAEADEREAREAARAARQHLKHVRQAATEAEAALAALQDS